MSPVFTWVVVADRAQARMFERRDAGVLHQVDELECTQGRDLEQALDTDRPGRRRGVSPRPNPTTREQGAHEHLAQTFAGRIADCLRKARMEGRFRQLVLVAEPHFLGLLRSALDSETLKLAGETIGKGLGKASAQEIAQQLESTRALRRGA